VVIATAVRELRTAVEALKRGAYDYLTKPFDVDDILMLAQRAFEKRALEREVLYLRSALAGAPSDAGGLALMLRTIHESPKPVIARVQGDVYAGGMGLVAACDIAVSVDSAWYCLSEVKIGLVPATISPYVLRAMGTRAAQRWFLTAERFTAAEAHRIGFVHEVVSADALDAKVAEIVKALASASPAAVRACKTLIADVAGREIDDALVAKTVQGIADIRASEEGREGVQSFLQKRKPSWING